MPNQVPASTVSSTNFSAWPSGPSAHENTDEASSYDGLHARKGSGAGELIMGLSALASPDAAAAMTVNARFEMPEVFAPTTILTMELRDGASVVAGPWNIDYDAAGGVFAMTPYSLSSGERTAWAAAAAPRVRLNSSHSGAFNLESVWLAYSSSSGGGGRRGQLPLMGAG